MGVVHTPEPRLAGITAALAITAALLLAAAASLIPALLGDLDCSNNGDASATPTAEAKQTIPSDYLTLYRQAGTAFSVPWAVLAAIGAIESDHGRSAALGVQS